ncbi:CDGSH iron-sulfur domain-containing protein [Kribbella sp. VKM Ac-2566]|uniref:CDGSH iron-sulfur domain-containing protein n=1 Tax=Kribbella sp. VKM Ac-2566 TaxID=2512218 RepID=UPI001062CC44|nr:CDGSH iron-sulfur domain-containing protein [Kribbella sp. VKM Ac-2566]TDW79589.1 iron-binding CDGSH zinc finger protein [Kribbella sp. VKM Ac-2566]
MTEIRAYPDGPLLVRGEFDLLDENGDPIPAGRRTIALCRCGRSGIPPFCDGTHTLPTTRPPKQPPPT